MLGFRYKEKNIRLNPSITKDGNFDVYDWSVSNLPPIQLEDNGPAYGNQFPVILLAPNRFELDNKSGSLTTWKDFGYWYYELSFGMDSLSASAESILSGACQNMQLMTGQKRSLSIIT